MVVVVSMTLSAAALESKTIFRQNGDAAVASWFDGTNSTGLSVTETDDGTDVFVSICTLDVTGSLNCKFGFTNIQEDVFAIDKKLTTATLSPVKIDLFDFNTGTVETITVQAQWTGAGDLAKTSFRFTSKSGEFTAKFSDSSSIRDATATGSINNQDLGTSEFANLIAFKSASMTMEK